MNPGIQALTDIIVPIAVSVLVGGFGWLTSFLIDALKPHLSEKWRAKTKGAITQVTVWIITALVGFIPSLVSWSIEADSSGWTALVITAMIAAKGRHLSEKANSKEAQPESIDLAVGLGMHLKTLPSGDSGQEALTVAMNYLLDETLPDVVAEAGVLAEQTKGGTNE